ncbi:hypothetical protein [Pseudoalteromonas marina]|uniref:Uncharacterized protein n=1 Tax=Pseudoalteromonas marina TaxID=267375 RepID=A0ABT9FC96_9GAMM|nr:hypothetical protein [Pseudoalteromonas marina]MDP2564409.1 hypothetical protein [Pseudoalteromonas marina]
MNDFHNRQFDDNFLQVLDSAKSMIEHKPKGRGFFSLYSVILLAYAILVGVLEYLGFSMDLPILLLTTFVALLSYDLFFVFKRNLKLKKINAVLKTVGCRMDLKNFIVIIETGEVVRIDYLYEVAALNVTRQTQQSN